MDRMTDCYYGLVVSISGPWVPDWWGLCSLQARYFCEICKEKRVGTSTHILLNKIEEYWRGHKKRRQAHVELCFDIIFEIHLGEGEVSIKLSVLGVLLNKLKPRVLWIGLMSPNSLAKILIHFSIAQWFRVPVLDQSFQLPVTSNLKQVSSSLCIWVPSPVKWG